MLDFHLGEERGDFRKEVEIVFKHVSFKHGVEIFRDFISFLDIMRGTWKQLLRLSAIYAISGT